eukprot:snap_masked-scaffold_31-processed-gene-2.36-mRNA-1 protein AED:1.00 eAED:1.00 QI:0/0/0/0/1/1/3/0/564
MKDENKENIESYGLSPNALKRLQKYKNEEFTYSTPVRKSYKSGLSIKSEESKVRYEYKPVFTAEETNDRSQRSMSVTDFSICSIENQRKLLSLSVNLLFSDDLTTFNTSSMYKIKSTSLKISSPGEKEFETNFSFVSHAENVFMNAIDDLTLFKKSFRDNLQPQSSNGGKSGSSFFRTADSKYLLKEIKENEKELLLNTNFLIEYISQLKQNPLLARIVSIVSILHNNTCAHTYIIMQNMKSMINKLHIKNIYDLKGSIYNRVATIDTSVLKDLDFTSVFINERYRTVKETQSYGLFIVLSDPETLPKQIPNEEATRKGVKAALLKAFTQQRSPSVVKYVKNETVGMRKIKLKYLGFVTRSRDRVSSSIFRRVYHSYEFEVNYGKSMVISKRYKEFEKLYNSLVAEVSIVSLSYAKELPALPPKRGFGFMSEEFVSERGENLSNWLNEIIQLVDSNPERSKSLYNFLLGNNFSFSTIEEVKENFKISGNLSEIKATEITMDGEHCPVILRVGIVDFLQQYTMRKRVESLYKGYRTGARYEISTIDSTAYAERFIKFIFGQVFVT